jgi:hypothetical protein
MMAIARMKKREIYKERLKLRTCKQIIRVSTLYVAERQAMTSIIQ